MVISKVKNLSDDQLVTIYRNPSTSKEIKKIVLNELSLREIDDLSSETLKDDDVEFTKNEKLQLIFLPFFYRKHRNQMFKEGWSRKRDKQFWSYITLGFAIYSFILLFTLLFRNR